MQIFPFALFALAMRAFSGGETLPVSEDWITWDKVEDATVGHAVAGDPCLVSSRDGGGKSPVAEERLPDVEALTQEIQKSPTEGALYSRRGDAYLFGGRFAEAVADFEKMIILDPMQDAPHWRLGIAYYFAGQYEKAARQFEKYHTYESRDRENGIWRFLAQAKAAGIERARGGMLRYEHFDREPFPALYEMFTGTASAADVLRHLSERDLSADQAVQFFAHYYIGLNEELHGRTEVARAHLGKAVAVYDLDTPAPGGASYMWRVARLHLQQLRPK